MQGVWPPAEWYLARLNHNSTSEIVSLVLHKRRTILKKIDSSAYADFQPNPFQVISEGPFGKQLSWFVHQAQVPGPRRSHLLQFLSN